MGIIDRVKNLASGSGEEIPLQEYDKNVIPSRDQPSADIDVVPSDIETPPAWFEPSSYEIGDEPISVPKSEKDIDVIPSKKFTKQTPFFIKDPYAQGEETPSEYWGKRREPVTDGEQVEFNPDGTIKSKPTDETIPEESKPSPEPSPESTTTENEPLEYPKDEPSKPTEKTWGQKQWETVKKKVTLERAGQAIFGSPLEEIDHARKGGYTGDSKGTLLQKNQTLELNNEALQKKFDASNERITDLEEQRNELERKKDKTPEDERRLESIRKSIIDEKRERDKIETKIIENRKVIDQNNSSINRYEEAVRKGKQESATRSVVGKKLSALGKGTSETIQSGVWEGKLNKDWFGPKGFLSQPYMKSTSPVEPVRSKSANLNAYTRMTGQSVGRSMADAVTTVRASKSIAPMGVPGTVAGAKNQFDYAIPAKRIGLGEINTANINRDILPSIYDTPKPQAIQPVVEQQYKQVIQQDGTITNVPVPTQQRKPKVVTISVNRFAHRSPNVSGKSFITGSSKFVISGKNFSGMGSKKAIIINPISPMASQNTKLSCNVEGCGISKKSLGKESVKTLSKINIGLDGLGPNRTIKSATFRERPEIDLGLINIKRMGMKINKSQNGVSKSHSNINIETMVEDRKAKDSLPLVNINFSKSIGKNIDKILKKPRKK